MRYDAVCVCVCDDFYKIVELHTILVFIDTNAVVDIKLQHFIGVNLMTFLLHIQPLNC